MIDLHSHILYGIDDGSTSIEESIEILKKYEQIGINNIVLTPHYISDGEYKTNNKEKIKLFNILNDRKTKANIKINLYLGNEVYACNNIIELLEKDEIMSINNTKYILIEFPLFCENKEEYNIIHNIVLNGYIPIIAHPERYIYVQKDISILKEYIKLGALLQINKDSLFNKYGKSAKKTVKKIIKKRLATFIGTDIHSINNKIYSNDKLKRKIIRLSSKDYYNKITYENSYKTLNDKKN